jgi:hypothetical protein
VKNAKTALLSGTLRIIPERYPDPWTRAITSLATAMNWVQNTFMICSFFPDTSIAASGCICIEKSDPAA